MPGPVRWLVHPAAKPILFILLILPLVQLALAAVGDRLGPNPAEALIRSTGDWTLRLLCLSLAVTPFRVLTGWAALARFRRMVGLFAFAHGAVHLLCYALFDMGGELPDILQDIVRRPFILVGSLALLLLLPLALTSLDRAVRWLGGRRWRALHRLVYLAAPLAVLHFFWMRAGKNDFAEVAVYAAVLASLLGWRIVWHARQRQAARPADAGSARV
ncbi:MAG: sulfoxide reductase heme-binding subunit YedZ [Rhodoferax sp.]|nr:sulfoxide reductase heme-binding subunit YedZ [Rhodoferax sp.]